MRKTYRIFILLFCWAVLIGAARAETFHLAGGQTLTGDIVSMDDQGIILKQPDGSYGERTPWTKLSQADLKDLEANNPKAAQFVTPYIEQTQAEKMQRTEIDVKNVDRLPRPARQSLIGAMFTSPMGLFLLLIIYGANLAAGYEIAIFRGHSVGLVLGVSAVLPFIGPIIFLCMAANLQKKQADWVAHPEQHLEPEVAAAIAAEEAATAVGQAEVATTAAEEAAKPAAPSLPPTKSFLRGQFTFNRRFFETQMPAFFAVSRPDAEKDKVLLIKSVRGSFVAQRISRATATDVTFQVTKGVASEDVTIPFVEIQEVHLKHKDA